MILLHKYFLYLSLKIELQDLILILSLYYWCVLFFSMVSLILFQLYNDIRNWKKNNVSSYIVRFLINVIWSSFIRIVHYVALSKNFVPLSQKKGLLSGDVSLEFYSSLSTYDEKKGARSYTKKDTWGKKQKHV